MNDQPPDLEKGPNPIVHNQEEDSSTAIDGEPDHSEAQPKHKPGRRKARAQQSAYKSYIPASWSIWEQVQDKNESGNYNFERFESIQLLNLCLQQHEVRLAADEVYTVIKRLAEENKSWRVAYPEEELRERASRLKGLLREYNESLLQVRKVMSLPMADVDTIRWYDKTESEIPRLMTDLRQELDDDGLRSLLHDHYPTWAKRTVGLFAKKYGRFRKQATKWINLPGYTLARVEELEKGAFRTVVDNTARVILSIFAGASLLVPMIAMLYTNSRMAHLLITCLFVLAFGIILAFGSKASNQEILGATAGYAAVLVVFIGTSGGGG